MNGAVRSTSQHYGYVKHTSLRRIELFIIGKGPVEA
jgi:hypothetical protein